MKRLIVFVVLSLALSLVLFGCGGSAEPTDPTGSTGQATQATEATEAALESTSGSSIILETPDPNANVFVETEATEPDYTPYYDILKADSPLRDAMNCSFTKPEEMSLAYVFYGSLAAGGWDDLSETSVAKLEAAGFSQNLELQIRPAKDLENILQTYFGISLKDIKNGIPESWVYIKEDDCYYTNHSDALGFPEFTITWVDTPSDSRVDISYTIDSEFWYDTQSKTYLDHPNMIMILEKAEDGTYRMVSNSVVPSK